MAVLDNAPTEQTQEEREAAALEHQRARGDFLDDEGGTAPAGATGTTGADAGTGATGADAAALAAIAGDDDESDRQVPYPRFREVNDKLTAEREARARLEGENAALKAATTGGAAAAPKETAPDMLAVDVKATRKAANAAMLEGDTDKADELAALADEALMAQSEDRAVKRIQKQRVEDAQAAEQDALNQAAVDVVKIYPELDSNNPKANKEAIGDVLALRNTYMANGKSGAEALREAADKVAKMHGYAKPAAEGTASSAASATEEARKRREREAAQRGASASQHQPPPPAGRGDRGNAVLDPNAIDVAKMSDKEFKGLSDAEKSRLRGDVLP